MSLGDKDIARFFLDFSVRVNAHFFTELDIRCLPRCVMFVQLISVLCHVFWWMYDGLPSAAFSETCQAVFVTDMERSILTAMASAVVLKDGARGALRTPSPSAII